VTARILVADDSAIIRKSLNLLLSEHTNWIICGEASNGQEAIAMAKELKPDLIILDLAMPVLNGLQAAEEILRSTPKVPIVIYTLHQNHQVELESKEAGARRVMYKGDSTAALLHCLEELLRESKAVSAVSLGDQAQGITGELLPRAKAHRV
jgi:DNA-binding NarL/FixJ family response regulator